MHAPDHFPDVAYVPVREGVAFRGEVIDVHTQRRLTRTASTYANPSDATSAATSLWRAKQAALLQQIGQAPQAVMA